MANQRASCPIGLCEKSTIPHSLLGLFLASLELLRVVEWIANLFDFGQSQGTLASLGVLGCGFQGVLDPRLD